MDTLRGNFGHLSGDHSSDDDGYYEDDHAVEPPPGPVGQDERRMQVRAYNHWASLLDDRNFPSIKDLKPDELPDFGPFSVLLDFSNGIEDPGLSYLGQEIAEECGTATDIERLADIPSRSLLSRITDHYMQILANQAPIGFEAEFVNQREKTILYRGILLPFSSDDENIDFIYGVINWKELADAQTTDELLLEIDQALAQEPEFAPQQDEEEIADWADGPASLTSEADGLDDEAEQGWDDDSDIPDVGFGSLTGGGFSAKPAAEKRDALSNPPLIEPVSDDSNDDTVEQDDDHFTGPVTQPHSLDTAKLLQGDEEEFEDAPLSGALNALSQANAANDVALGDVAVDLDDFAPETLADWLALARESATEARSCEDRSRRALYAAVSQAYDFALAADAAPDQYAEILSDAGLTAQERAPMTPIVKLVFGVDYDKTRLTEYAAVLSYAQRESVAQGEMESFVAKFDGGLKGIVSAERAYRRAETGKTAKVQPAVRGKIAKTLRSLSPVQIEDIAAQGEEFALVMVRREADGSLSMIGEVPADNALVSKAARKLAEQAS